MSEPKRILLVDDQATFAKAIEIALADTGCEIQSVTDPELGLQKALSETWDLLLLDMHMPVMNGVEFLHHLREAGCQIRTVVMSSDSSLTPVQDIEPYHVEAFVLKPIQLHDFSDLLEKLIGLSLFPKGNERTANDTP
ncbi:MAG: response regulator [Candidatus Sericytochromatia bacterium]|nr:response regulator [Candidatus Sericytochromatia bacterium]